MNSKCKKNSKHNFNNIYFETFDKYFLKEKELNTCQKCANVIENKNKYKCKKCSKFFCSSCFIAHKHIQKDLNNLELITSHCPKDQEELNNFCINCGEKICLYCIKNNKKNNEHKSHRFINALECMPSKFQINLMKQIIKNKSESFNNIIKSIDDWKNQIDKKISHLKKNLIYEIKILEKLFYSYNQFYIDYVHYSNFNRCFKNLENYNNQNLKNFMNSDNLELKTKYLIDALFYHEKKLKKTQGHLENVYNSYKIDKLEYLGNNYFLNYSEEKNLLSILSLNNDNGCNISFSNIASIVSPEKIISFGISNINNNIYACLDKKKLVFIFNYDAEEKYIKLTEEQIYNKNDITGNFNRCIPISDDSIITCDNINVYLWKRISELNEIRYENVDNYYGYEHLYDIAFVNNQYIVLTKSEKLIFLEKNLEMLNHIIKLDCIEEENSIIDLNDFILVNCVDGINIISLKTKEIVQFIQNWNNWDDKIMVKSSEEQIYIVNKSDKIINKFNLEDSCLIHLEEINIVNDGEEDKDGSEEEDYNENIIVTGDNIIVFCDESIHLLIKN